MKRASFERVESILLLGAHADDIEIGCGGTVLELVSRYPEAEFVWVVFSAHGDRATEARRSAEAFLRQVPRKRIILREYRDGFFPFEGAEIKGFFEELKRDLAPDIILTHYGEDLHQDHRTLSQLTWNTFRNHVILEYEIPKYDGGLGSPNFYFPIREDLKNAKIRHLLEFFPTQATKPWFSEDTFSGLMRIRGLECNSPSLFAEAYYAKKLVG